MKQAVVLDSLDDTAIGGIIERQLISADIAFTRFRLPDMTIFPCRSCGSCGLSTPGICAFNDDMPHILKAVGPAGTLIFLTRITFGGYSSQLKKAIDKLMVLGYPLYTVKKGHMLHPMRYGKKSLLVIGVAGEHHCEGKESNFRLLAQQNAMNLMATYRETVLHPGEDTGTEMSRLLATAERPVPL